MAEVDYEDQPQSPLDQVRGAFQTIEGQQFADEATARINDYVQRRDLADANRAAGEAFVANLGEMQQNYVGLVRDDPTAVHLALDLARLSTRAMVETVPNADPAHVDTIAGDMEREIARAAVGRLAEVDDGAARSMLGDSRLSALLPDEDRNHLSGYISAQSAARKIDNQAAARMAERAQAQQIDGRAWNYLAALADPETGAVSTPPDWAKTLIADPALPPPVKAGLLDIYGRIERDGDAVATDPVVASRLVAALAGDGRVPPSEILTQAGDTMRLADALTLARMAGDPAQRGRIGAMAETLGEAERQLAPPENGPAGQIAYERFVNWLLPAVRGGANLDPGSQDYLLAGNRLQSFAPRATDAVVASVQTDIQNRRPLADIFGGMGGDGQRTSAGT